MPIRLGELLLKENMVSPQQLQDALNHAKLSGGKIGKAFVSLGFVTDEEITSLLSRQYGVPSINLDHFEVDPAIIKIIPAETARKYQVLPLSRSGATLTIAMADPTNVFAMDDIKFMTGYNVEPVVASETTIEDSIDRYYGSMRFRKRIARAQTKRAVWEAISKPRRPAKRRANLRATWQDESYWLGEVCENESLGLHVSWYWGHGAECESGNRGDGNDIAVSVAEGVDFLRDFRAAEVERRMPILGPPISLEEAFVKSGDPMKMAALLDESTHAWEDLNRERQRLAEAQGQEPKAHVVLKTLGAQATGVALGIAWAFGHTLPWPWMAFLLSGGGAFLAFLVWHMFGRFEASRRRLDRRELDLSRKVWRA